MKNVPAVLIILVVILIVAGAGYLISLGYKFPDNSKAAASLCIQKCKEAISSRDLSSGPCLLNPVKEFPDWVCDVVHSPRQLVDDQLENQCSAFRNGLASHFVEVSTNCNLVRSQ